MKSTVRRSFFSTVQALLPLAGLLSAIALSGCSKSEHITTDSGSASEAMIPKTIPADAKIPNVQIGPKNYFPVEATLTDSSFARLVGRFSAKNTEEKKKALRKEFGEVFKTLRGAGAIDFNLSEEVGYFTFYLPYPEGQQSPDFLGALRAIKPLKYDHNLIFNPVTQDGSALAEIKALTSKELGLESQGGGSRDGFSNFSGLTRIHAPEFVRLAESEIGGDVKVNGDSVNLGITDTGITLNHPTFMSADKVTNRVTYLKDFTREGRVYFNLNAKFSAAPVPGTEDKLVVTADWIPTPRLPSLPAGDLFNTFNALEIQVSAELKALLTAPNTNAKLGILLEKSISSEAEEADLNGNGKTDDEIPMILIPGAKASDDVLYVDMSGTGDFRDATPLKNWNTSKTTVEANAEKIGFDIEEDKLPSSNGKDELQVRSASIVGYDPGNHGTHVAGIAAGLKTISNDAPDTLARGVAPEAKILLNRVCANNGGCNATQAMIDLATQGGANVINMSLGGLNTFNDGYGVQETIINRLTALKNVLFVISAGNSGPGKQTVGSPSTARMSLSVGASASTAMIQRQYQWPAGSRGNSPEQDEDFMLFFSSRGPTAAGGFKPNLVAPGTELSSIQLNAAPGSRGGLDVYWGTSMAAPTATGAYALLLDAVNKFNAKHPDQALASDAVTLRRVLMESARAFDVASFNPQTGAKTSGRYTWIDQGTGMIDLVAAWKKLAELRAQNLGTAVNRNGTPVELDYQVLVSGKAPNGNNYDGTTPSQNEPVFGTGLYVDYYGTETLRPVYISRLLPFKMNELPEGGSLTRDLETSADEFVLKTVIHGSDKTWVRAGVLDVLGDTDSSGDCNSLETANLTVIGKGVDVKVASDGTAKLAPFPASTLNVCINRRIIRNELAPGDHGALISAYRVVNGKVASVPSFWIPVYVQVPNQTLAGSTAYEIQSTVRSFDVARNYVTIPKGTSLVQITLEVPPLKKDANGLKLAGEKCSGVELMALQGTNSSNPIAKRTDARVSNCDSQGKPVDTVEKRRLVYTKTSPTPGTWDIHIFGQYKYALSKYTLRVDYLTANTSVQEIAGGIAALNGALDWNVAEASLAVAPEVAKSQFLLNGLLNVTKTKLNKGDAMIVASPLGEFRAYPADATSVTLSTGGSRGNDIDIAVLACDATAKSLNDPSCEEVGKSTGPTDEEAVTFTPKTGKVYALQAAGFDIKDSGEFTASEKIILTEELGSLSVSGTAPSFNVKYGFSNEQIASSRLLNSDLFKSGQYQVVGNLTLKTAEEVSLFAVPVKIQK